MQISFGSNQLVTQPVDPLQDEFGLLSMGYCSGLEGIVELNGGSVDFLSISDSQITLQSPEKDEDVYLG